MTTSNNSGNNSSGGTVIITGTGGGGGGGAGNCAGSGTGASNGGWFTVTVPTIYTGGTITWNPNIQPCLPDIDLAVPVDEKKKKSDGCSCKKCKEFFEYAEPNQEDGTLICWACRHGY